MPEKHGYQFIKKTYYSAMEDSGEEQKLPQPPLELDYPAKASLIPLPEPEEMTHIPDIELREAIERRKTARRYDESQSLTLEELSYLLWITQGVRQVTERPVTFRNVPSAGARHAFETYLVVNRVDGLEPGLYRFIALENALLKVDAPQDITQQVSDACLKQQQIIRAAVTFIWVAVTERMYWRYGERGYRYLHLDAGHVCQNLYLGAEAIGCGTCAIAAYDDEMLNSVLSLDGNDLWVIYVAPLGKRLPPEK
ncbi:MAG TPA: SagB/ThcOx family dehydrogenase [Longilinea sp.]|nr:SagB/ThcOx family dehydrogenase [Longilinea sp.]